VVFGILAIPAVYALGARLFDRATGMTAAALLSVHSSHVAFSQEARGYSLLIFLLILATYALISAMESKQEAWPWIMFAVSAALCVYAHIFAVLVLAAHALAMWVPRPFRVQLKTGGNDSLRVRISDRSDGGICAAAPFDQISWVPKPALGEVVEFLRLLTSQGGLALMVLLLCPMRIGLLAQRRRGGLGQRELGIAPPGCFGWCCRRESRSRRR